MMLQAKLNYRTEERVTKFTLLSRVVIRRPHGHAAASRIRYRTTPSRPNPSSHAITSPARDECALECNLCDDDAGGRKQQNQPQSRRAQAYGGGAILYEPAIP